MTAARLEELAVWAENEQREQRFDGSFQRDQNYADLARCARGWAKVEEELRRQGGSSISLVLGCSGGFYSSFHFAGNTVAPTALEAVEAAGKDNLNG